MKLTELILLLCTATCWAQMEPLLSDVEDGGEMPSSLVDDGQDIVPIIPGSDEESLIRCKRPLCDDMCPYGALLGEDGCPSCDCKTPEDLCKELGECPEGTRCEVPTCFGEMCLTLRAECIPECPMVKCDECPNDKYLKDDQGCQTCQCAEGIEYNYQYDEEEGTETDSTEKKCSDISCLMFCEYGFQKDINGCEMCKCRRQPEYCSDVMCMMFCEYGFEKDERGCDICRCRQQPASCPKRTCDPVQNCENGFQKDELGCDTCECKDVCAQTECKSGLSCKPVTLSSCPSGSCPPIPVCQAPSVCELHQGHSLSGDEMAMMMPHLSVQEQTKLFRGPANCRPDGLFEPKQCFDGECFCIDDRRVMQEDSFNIDDPLCELNVTKNIQLTFELMHDLDDNDIDGAMKDIEELVRNTLGEWMALPRNSVLLVQVAYIKPGYLLVISTVVNNGFSDLLSATHHLHRKFFDGECSLNYKHHVLTPNPSTVNFEHHYKNTHDPESYFVDESRYGGSLNSTSVIVTVLCTVVFFLVLTLAVILVMKKKRRSANYQFQHRRMQNMESFKKDLILNSELNKPNLLSNDVVKVSLTDETKKPLE